MPNWTPGPWRIGKLYVCHANIESDSMRIARTECLSSTPENETKNLANAQLIAAAPDLYAALEEMLKHGEHEGPCDNIDPGTGWAWEGTAACELHIAASKAREKIARAALAKARGEQNAE